MVIRGARYAPSQERETPSESTKKRALGRAKITARLVSRCVDSIDQIDPKPAFAGDPWNTLGITGWLRGGMGPNTPDSELCDGSPELKTGDGRVTRTFRRRVNFPHGSAFPPTRDRRRA